MVIDIDAFLDKYKSINNLEKPKSDNVINLDFQKDVETKLDKTQKNALSSDYDILKKVYSEIKSFDQDIPNKFLGIEKKGSYALKSLGNKYSKDFVLKVTNNKNILKSQIENNLIKIQTYLNKKQYSSSISLFKETLEKYNTFPNDFFNEKSDLNLKINEIEFKMYSIIDNYKSNELNNKKKELISKIKILKNSLTPYNIIKIRENISNLELELESIPKVFFSDFLKEKSYAAKLLSNANQFLKNEYKLEFEQKKTILLDSFNKFHQFNLDRNLDGVLITYDEILFQFNSLPDSNLEEKMKLYSEINILYNSINDLIIKNNVSRFLESYNGSKTLHDAKEYLRHSNNIKKINLDTLKLLKSKIESVPSRFDFEKNSLLDKINNIISSVEMKLEKSIPIEEVKQPILDNDGIEKFNLNETKKSIQKFQDNLEKDKISFEEDQINYSIKEKKKKLNKFYLELLNSQNLIEFKKLYLEINNILKDLKQDKNLDTKIIYKINLLAKKKLEEINKKLSPKTFKKQKENILPKKNISNKSILNEVKTQTIAQSTTFKNKNLMKELNEFFNEISITSDKVKLKELYKKIKFKLDSSYFSSSKKQEILRKVKSKILNKKLN